MAANNRYKKYLVVNYAIGESQIFQDKEEAEEYVNGELENSWGGDSTNDFQVFLLNSSAKEVFLETEEKVSVKIVE